MNPAQASAFQANGGIAATDMAVVLISVALAVLILWGAWALRTAYIGWAEQRISLRQFLGVALRFIALYLVLSFFLLS
jgi:integrating conjugative element protein (TIGR03758 family)